MLERLSRAAPEGDPPGRGAAQARARSSLSSWLVGGALLCANACQLREFVLDGDETSAGETEDEVGESAEDGPCSLPQVLCADECTAVESDVEHCGGCGVVCLPGQTCESGGCENSTEECECEEGLELCVEDGCVCRPGLVECAEGCVDIETNPAHCGGCEQPCDDYCVDGECVEECEAPKSECGELCVDVGSDPLHCEECGESCSADQLCVQGECRSFTASNCTTCPCDCGEGTCCESTQLDATVCVQDQACPP